MAPFPTRDLHAWQPPTAAPLRAHGARSRGVRSVPVCSLGEPDLTIRAPSGSEEVPCHIVTVQAQALDSLLHWHRTRPPGRGTLRLHDDDAAGGP